jgi:hypothetical protein
VESEVAMGMLRYTGNTVYLDVHKDVFLSDVTIYVESWSDRSGVFSHQGVLKIAAVIVWPDFGGYIWHYVTDVEVSDYDLYQEMLGTVQE